MTHPEGVKDLESVDHLDSVKGNFAECVAILNTDSTHEIRVWYLKNHREEWEWVESVTSEKHDNGWVQFKRRDK